MTKKELIEKLSEKSDEDAIDEFLTVVSPEKPSDDKPKDDNKIVTLTANELYNLFQTIKNSENIEKGKEEKNVFNF